VAHEHNIYVGQPSYIIYDKNVFFSSYHYVKIQNLIVVKNIRASELEVGGRMNLNPKSPFTVNAPLPFRRSDFNGKATDE